MLTLPFFPPFLFSILEWLGQPLLALLLSAWLCHAPLRLWCNGLIMLSTIIMVAALWSLFAAPLVGGFVGETMILTAFSGWIITCPLAWLHRRLSLRLPSPFALCIRKHGIAIHHQGSISKATTTVAALTPRASHLPPGATWKGRTEHMVPH